MDPTTNGVVELAGLTVRFPRRSELTVRDVSLRLAPGEHVVVLGASGSGKSTVLNAITGVVPHTVNAEVSGAVAVAGATSRETSVVERSRHVAVVTQDPSSSVCLPIVEQELALPLESRAADPPTIGPRIAAVLDVVGAAHLHDRATATLSGGESQRVALAAALVAEPEVLLLDEPTSMLDPAGMASVRGALEAAVSSYGPAMVLVEHRLDDWAGPDGIAGLPSRAIALSEFGTVLADGPTDVVLRDHARQLHEAGCWLPLEAELQAYTGSGGGLANPVNTAYLTSLGDSGRWAEGHDGGDSGPWAEGHTEPILRTHGLAVARDHGEPDSQPLLKGIELDVRPGEVVALLGANGVGKSTLLLTLAGLIPPYEGRVDGSRPGLVFQNAEHQFVANTVWAEIAHGLPPATAQDVVATELKRHRLTALAEQNPFRLSGGEKRRVSLAAMLAHRRPVLLADEPTLGLDRRDAIATVHTLRGISAGGGAVVLASHDLRTVAALADRVIVLGDGGGCWPTARSPPYLPTKRSSPRPASRFH